MCCSPNYWAGSANSASTRTSRPQCEEEKCRGYLFLPREICFLAWKLGPNPDTNASFHQVEGVSFYTAGGPTSGGSLTEASYLKRTEQLLTALIMSNGKFSWRGTIVSIQPRIRLSRSFDQRHHSYLGYALRVLGSIGQEEGEFLVGIGKAAQANHQFQKGDVVEGQSEPVKNPSLEPVGYYKASGLLVIQHAKAES